MKYYKILALLAEIASENGNDYSVTDYACGFIPFKNGENQVQEIGHDFFSVAQWLLSEAELKPKQMKTATVTYELEETKFNAMETILLRHGFIKEEYDMWDLFVINTYYNTERYLDFHNGDLNSAYEDMRYDF